MTAFFQLPTSLQLPVPHIHQQNAGECLAACVAMVCAYWRIEVKYRNLLDVLEIEPDVGTPFSKIRYLSKLGLSIRHWQSGRMIELYRFLSDGWPCIVSVRTGELPYWQSDTSHTLTVVGMTETHILAHDPELSYGPAEISIGDFELAWLEMDERFAVIEAPILPGD